MKMINKIFAAAIAAAIAMQSGVMCVLAEENPSVAYSFKNLTPGIADGVITVSGIPSDATYVKLYWGSGENTPLTDYSPIKNYTSSETVKYNESALVLTDGSISYEVEGSRYLPEEAKYIVAEITNADASVTTVSSPLSNTGFSEDDMLYSMFWISDTHTRWFSYKPSSNLNKGFRAMRSVADKDGEKFKGVIINGDMADSAKYYEYGILENIIQNTMSDDYPVFYNVGNHDLVMYGKDDFASAMDIRFDRLSEMGYTFEKTDEWSYDTYINGQHYIFLALPVSTSYEISNSQCEWLEAQLSEGDKSGAKNFLFVHLTVKDTVPASSKSGCLNDTNEEFAKIMERHPNTVVMTSHIHLEMDCDMKTVLVNENSPSYMDTSSLYYTGVYPSVNGDSVYGKLDGHAYGRYAQIYADKVVIKTMNFVNSKWVPRAEYVIPVDNSVQFNGTVSISNSADDLTAGNVLTAKLDGADIDTDKYSCEWFVSGVGSVGTDTTYTIATENKNVSLKVTDKETEAYAYATTGVYSYTEPEDETPDSENTLTPPVMTNDNTVVENDGVIMVTGNVGSTNAGEKVMLVIAPQSSYNDLSTAKYINEVVVESDGSYTFKFKADDVNEDDVLMAKLDEKDITNSIITVKGANEFGVDMTLTLSSENIPSLSFVNKYLDTTEDTTVVLATYDENGRMLKADTVTWDMLFGAYGENQTYKFSSAVEGATVKAFIFRDLQKIKPLAESQMSAITVLSAE